MSDAIRSMSLDDWGDAPGQGAEKKAREAAPQGQQYQLSSDEDFGSTPGTGPYSQVSQAFGKRPGEATSSGTVLTRMTSMFGGFDQRRSLRNSVLLGALLVAAGGLLYVSSQQADLTGLGGAPEADGLPEAEPVAIAPATPAFPVVEGTLREPTAEDLVNPYWSLPNPLVLQADQAPRGVLSQAQEERWRFSLSHPYTYQRYKAVQDMREARLKGSESLLIEAVAQPKFWTRMEALLALAELGQEIDIDTVESAIGNTRRGLVRNYFRRFEQGASSSDLFVMRQALRVVDAPTREVILRSLAQTRDPIHDLYLVAASYDPNPRIQEWVTAELRGAPVSAEVRTRFVRIVTGLEAPAPQSSGLMGTTEGGAATSVQDLKIEEVPTDVNVEEVYFLNEDGSLSRPEPAPVPRAQEKDSDDGFESIAPKAP